jgi:hypothetical protein
MKESKKPFKLVQLGNGRISVSMDHVEVSDLYLISGSIKEICWVSSVVGVGSR